MQLFGTIAIVLGLLFQIKYFIVKFVKFRNEMQGVKTEVSSVTLLVYRVSGIVMIIIGLAWMNGLLY